MNANQIINMVTRTIIRRLVNGGINAGINAVSKPRKSVGQGDQNAPQGNNAKQVKQAMRMTRKISRF